MPSSPPAEAVTVTPAALRAWPLPPPGEDKHARGSALVVGGAAGSPGAVLLAGVAALRAGAGRLQMAVAASAAPALAVAVPEALVVGLEEADTGSVEPLAGQRLDGLLGRADVVCVGPGLDDAERTAALLPELLGRVGEGARVVVDAYALGALAQRPATAHALTGRLVLTPNTDEAALLLGLDGSGELDDDLGAAAGEVAARYGAVVALRGHVAAPDGGTWVDGSGHAGLGTSGSGDVLAGLVAGLLARGAQPAQAAVWGSHLHAASGERLAARVGPLGYLARELLDEAPLVLAELSS